MQGNITLLWQKLLYTIYMYITLPSIRVNPCGFAKQTLEKTEGAIKNGQSMEN